MVFFDAKDVDDRYKAKMVFSTALESASMVLEVYEECADGPVLKPTKKRKHNTDVKIARKWT